MAARFRAYHEVAGHGADFCAIRPPPSRRGSPAEEIAQWTVAKYMIKRPRRPGQGWTTFLRNHADGIAAADLFVVPTIGFKLLYGLVILGHGRRRLIHHAVTAHPTAEWIAQQIVEAFPL